MRPKDAVRLSHLVVRSEAAEERRRRDWLFLSQAVVARELGTPDDVDNHKDGLEVWEYDIEYIAQDGETEEDSISFEFVRGRVIGLGGADAIPDD